MRPVEAVVCSLAGALLGVAQVAVVLLLAVGHPAVVMAEGVACQVYVRVRVLSPPLPLCHVLVRSHSQHRWITEPVFFGCPTGNHPGADGHPPRPQHPPPPRPLWLRARHDRAAVQHVLGHVLQPGRAGGGGKGGGSTRDRPRACGRCADVQHRGVQRAQGRHHPCAHRRARARPALRAAHQGARREARGATIIGTTSTPDKAKIAKSYGADHVILYKQEDTVQRVLELTNGEGVHAIFDGVGKDTCVLGPPL